MHNQMLKIVVRFFVFSGQYPLSSIGKNMANNVAQSVNGYWTLIFYSIMLTCHDISLYSLKHLDTTLIIMWQTMWNSSGIFPF